MSRFARTMTINGLSTTVNLPVAPSGGDDIVHALPPYHAVDTYKVSDYKCPDNWMHGSGNAESYFIKVETGRHLWLEFNDLTHHTHEVAVVLSVQGINPVTNKPCKNLRLEQYREQCPEHKVAFEAERFCPKCNHKWPAQNYMTTVSMPKGAFWIDGWHIGEGKIRGFLITEEAMRGVASQIIGKKRVYAIGIAFFVSKTPKPPQPERPRTIRTMGAGFQQIPIKSAMPSNLWVPPPSNDVWMGHKPEYKVDKNDSKYSLNSIPVVSCSVKPNVDSGDYTNDFCGGELKDYETSQNTSGGVEYCGSVKRKRIKGSPGGQHSSGGNQHVGMRGVLRSGLDNDTMAKLTQAAIAKKAEIAAGAQITQNLDYFDPSDLDFYSNKPAGLLYLNYALPAEFESIIAKPKVKRQKKDALSGLKVGNP